VRRRIVLTAIVAGALLLATTPAAARTNTRSKPIIFVHGLDAFFSSGSDCNSWNPMVSTLQSWGWTGSMIKLKYYAFDVNCTHALDHHGSHTKHNGGTGEHDVNDPSSHGFDSRIEHIAYHLAWYIYDHYSKNGITVDVVGHSMGGLIIRYAVAQSQRNHSEFPPYLYVEDVATLGSPHTGTDWARGCWWADQCGQMVPGSSFMNWLGSYAQNPQESGGTDWTTMGSHEDNYVSAGSATGMDATHRVRYYASSGVEHGDYLVDTSNTRTADVEYWDRPGPWYAWYDAPYAVRWTDFALYYGTW
jgi:pimeloyl-ACP methyl ester carboxylesterase